MRTIFLILAFWTSAIACNKAPSENQSSNTETGTENSAEQKIPDGTLVYPDFDASHAYPYSSPNLKKCSMVDCANPGEERLAEHKSFQAACEKEGYVIVYTSCCGLGSCTGLPKAVEP